MEREFELIERYYKGDLTKEELIEFENLKSVNKDFAMEVDLYKKTKDVIEISSRQRLKQQLNKIGREKLEDNNVMVEEKIKPLRNYWLKIAASVLILVTAGYFAFRNILAGSKPYSMEQIYSEYYVNPELDIITMRATEANTSTTSAWSFAIQKYNNKEYFKAVNEIEKVISNPDFRQKSAAHLLSGICYLNMNETESAIYHFKSVTRESSYIQEAAWYLGLCYLKSNNETLARKTFEEISNMPKHYKNSEAKSIIKLLNKVE